VDYLVASAFGDMRPNETGGVVSPGTRRFLVVKGATMTLAASLSQLLAQSESFVRFATMQNETQSIHTALIPRLSSEARYSSTRGSSAVLFRDLNPDKLLLSRWLNVSGYSLQVISHAGIQEEF
jgi:hypothetical protein